MIKRINVVMLGDSYKYSHATQYPQGVTNLFDYNEARSIKNYEKMVFVGLQGALKEYFTEAITERDVAEAELYATFHGIPFCRAGWDVIVNDYNGFIPVTVKAVPEGSVIPNKTVPFSVELTVADERIFWVVSWLETFLMKVWYTCNIATRSFYVKKMLTEMGKISDEKPFVDYQYHNFGDRGSSSVESAALGGFAHLTCFMGTDNFNSLKYTKEVYNVKDEDMGSIGHSIPATEHSTVTSWGKENEFKMVMNFLDTYKGRPESAPIACVGDSYDIFNFTDKITSGEFKEKIESADYPTFVIRPDSGYAPDIVNEMLNIMEKNNVAFTVNNKGYKTFNKYRIIWGDGINFQTMQDILSVLLMRKYSTQNMAFGSGGWLMQAHDRDTLGFAIKCSEVTFEDGSTRDVFKDPITDQGKKSKKGKVTTALNRNGKYVVVQTNEINDNTEFTQVLYPIFVNGKIINESTLGQIRKRINDALKVEIQG